MGNILHQSHNLAKREETIALSIASNHILLGNMGWSSLIASRGGIEKVDKLGDGIGKTEKEGGGIGKVKKIGGGIGKTEKAGSGSGIWRNLALQKSKKR